MKMINLSLSLCLISLFTTTLSFGRSGWNFEDGPAAGVLNAIQEMLPVYIDKSGACKESDLELVLKNMLNNLVAKDDLQTSDHSSNQSKQTVRKLPKAEKDCLKATITKINDENESHTSDKAVVPEEALSAVDAAFDLGLDIGKKK